MSHTIVRPLVLGLQATIEPAGVMVWATIGSEGNPIAGLGLVLNLVESIVWKQAMNCNIDITIENGLLDFLITFGSKCQMYQCVLVV